MSASKLSLPRDVILTLVGVLIGGVISHFYYAKSVADLKADAEERRRVEDLVFRGIESVGTIQYQRNAAGKVVGVTIELKGAASASASATGTLSNSSERKPVAQPGAAGDAR
jgi:hypothetical protein